MGLKHQYHKDWSHNYKTWSSKVMKSGTVLDIILELHSLGVHIEFIVSDYDSTICAYLQHTGTIINGKLPLDISQPTFIYNPSRHIKVMVKSICSLASQSKEKSECGKIDTIRWKNTSGARSVRASSYLLRNLKIIQSPSGTPIWMAWVMWPQMVFSSSVW